MLILKQISLKFPCLIGISKELPEADPVSDSQLVGMYTLLDLDCFVEDLPQELNSFLFGVVEDFRTGGKFQFLDAMRAS